VLEEVHTTHKLNQTIFYYKIDYFSLYFISNFLNPINDKHKNQLKMFSSSFLTLTILISSTFAVPLLFNPLLRLPDLKIVGGDVTEIEKFPYIASLQRFGSHICGCNIISETFILTAAHCTYGSSGERKII
jgi:hypothetical protein